MNLKVVRQRAAVVFLLSLIGCSTQHSIILMPDSDGHVGKAEVSTSAGKQLLEKAGDLTHVTKRQTAPSKVVAADPAYIAATFGEALAVEPGPSWKITLYFDSGTAALTTESLKAIASAAAIVEQRKAVYITISGHTDGVGSEAFNNKLAMKRANQVKDLLQKQGINLQLISASSFGKGAPAVPTPDGVAEPRNRRVDVTIQ